MRTAASWSATVLVLVAGAAVLLTVDLPAGAAPAWKSVQVADGWRTTSGSLALDDGRPRIALRRPSDHDAGGLAYAACDDGCTETEGWTVAELPVEGEVVPHLAVDDWGRPRIAFRKDGGVRYAACDTDCLDPDRWESTELVEAGDVGRDASGDAEGVAFALDGDGRPRVAYADVRERLRYLWCDAGCTRRSGWEDVTVSERGGAASVGDLTFDGIRPWIAYVRSDGGEDEVRFAVCGDDCGDRARWLDASVQRSSTSLRTPSLGLTARGQPRFAYTWGGRLVYRGCDRDCDIQSAWSPPVTVDSDPVGGSPTLVLDDGDRPRVAYSRDGVLRLAWCDETCTTDEGWSRQTVEAASDAARPSLAADGEQVHLAVTGATDREDPRVHYARCAEACGQPAPTAPAADGQGDPPPTGPTTPTSGPDPEPSPSPSPSLSATATGPSPSSSASVSTLGSPPVPGDRPTRRGPASVEETPTPSDDPGSASPAPQPAPQPSAISPASRSTDGGGSAWIVVVGGLAAAAVIGARRMDH